MSLQSQVYSLRRAILDAKRQVIRLGRSPSTPVSQSHSEDNRDSCNSEQNIQSSEDENQNIEIAHRLRLLRAKKHSKQLIGSKEAQQTENQIHRHSVEPSRRPNPQGVNQDLKMLRRIMNQMPNPKSNCNFEPADFQLSYKAPPFTAELRNSIRLYKQINRKHSK